MEWRLHNENLDDIIVYSHSLEVWNPEYSVPGVAGKEAVRERGHIYFKTETGWKDFREKRWTDGTRLWICSSWSINPFFVSPASGHLRIDLIGRRVRNEDSGLTAAVRTPQYSFLA
ncbi:hypothetical protein QVD17_19719 [Tagetes erecta]|uniref:Uncharacterized protein n=1 Tax=Tagetes erecta TaxID=13708 RepID=A0AAD8KRG5_TARER|nr:hypothetical protein QVD17_19719 [Tagetes erecta]